MVSPSVVRKLWLREVFECSPRNPRLHPFLVSDKLDDGGREVHLRLRQQGQDKGQRNGLEVDPGDVAEGSRDIDRTVALP